MLQNIIPALIGGLFTLIAAFITIYHQDLYFLFRFRKRKVKGLWNGQSTERLLDAESEELIYDVTIEFRQFGSRVSGKANIKSNLGENYQIMFKGRMEDEYFITLSAHSPHPQELSFGVALFELDQKATRLDGYGLANGVTQHGIALSKATLYKQPN